MDGCMVGPMDGWMDGTAATSCHGGAKKQISDSYFVLVNYSRLFTIFSPKGHKKKGEVVVHVRNKGAGSGQSLQKLHVCMFFTKDA